MTTRHLTCCVCSAPAGRWQQHWNRDTGWGICPPCAAEQAGTETPERMVELYGQPGVNYEPPQVRHFGRNYAVMATFLDNEIGTRAANAFMLRTPGASVLTTQAGRIFIVHNDDMGTAAP